MTPGQLEHLNLSEKDFDLIIEALEFLPDKGIGGELMGSIMGIMLTKDDEVAEKKLELEMRKRRSLKEEKMKGVKEDTKILAGKLLMLKRHLIEEGALKEAHDILGH